MQASHHGRYLLHYPAAVHLCRQRHDMTLHLIGKDLLLRLIAMLEEFLDHIIAEHIGHQLDRVWLYLGKNLVFLIRIGILQFLLNEARAVLITTEFNHVIVDVLLLIRRAPRVMRGDLP
jgi:hypothetical protein